MNICIDESMGPVDERKAKAASLMWRLALNPNNIDKFLAIGTFPFNLVTLIRRSNESYTKALETLCMLAFTLMNSSKEMRSRFREVPEFCNILVQRLIETMQHEKIGGSLCAIIGLLCEDHEATKERFAIMGVCSHAMINYLTKHYKLALAVKQSCKALTCVITNEKVRKQILEKKTTKLFFTVLGHHVNDVSVVPIVCAVILTLLQERTKEHEQAFVIVENSLETILTALQIYKNNTSLVISLSQIIHKLRFERHPGLYAGPKQTLLDVFEAQLTHGAEVNALCFKSLALVATDMNQQITAVIDRLANLIILVMERYYQDDIFLDSFISTFSSILTNGATILIRLLHCNSRFWYVLFNGCKTCYERRYSLDRWSVLLELIGGKFPSADLIVEIPGYIEYCANVLVTEAKRPDGILILPFKLLDFVIFTEKQSYLEKFIQCPNSVEILFDIIPRELSIIDHYWILCIAIGYLQACVTTSIGIERMVQNKKWLDDLISQVYKSNHALPDEVEKLRFLFVSFITRCPIEVLGVSEKSLQIIFDEITSWRLKHNMDATPCQILSILSTHKENVPFFVPLIPSLMNIISARRQFDNWRRPLCTTLRAIFAYNLEFGKQVADKAGNIPMLFDLLRFETQSESSIEELLSVISTILSKSSGEWELEVPASGHWVTEYSRITNHLKAFSNNRRIYCACLNIIGGICRFYSQRIECFLCIREQLLNGLSHLVAQQGISISSAIVECIYHILVEMDEFELALEGERKSAFNAFRFQMWVQSLEMIERIEQDPTVDSRLVECVQKVFFVMENFTEESLDGFSQQLLTWMTDVMIPRFKRRAANNESILFESVFILTLWPQSSKLQRVFADNIDRFAELVLFKFLKPAPSAELVILVGRKILGVPRLFEVLHESMELLEGDACVELMIHLISKYGFSVMRVLSDILCQILLPHIAIQESFLNSSHWMELLIGLLEQHKDDEKALQEILFLFANMSECITVQTPLPWQYPFFQLLVDIGKSFFKKDSHELLRLICISLGAICTMHDVDKLLAFCADIHAASLVQSETYLQTLKHVLVLFNDMENSAQICSLVAQYAELVIQIAHDAIESPRAATECLAILWHLFLEHKEVMLSLSGQSPQIYVRMLHHHITCESIVRDVSC
jgi:hypothetical protein